MGFLEIPFLKIQMPEVMKRRSIGEGWIDSCSFQICGFSL